MQNPTQKIPKQTEYNIKLKANKSTIHTKNEQSYRQLLAPSAHLEKTILCLPSFVIIYHTEMPVIGIKNSMTEKTQTPKQEQKQKNYANQSYNCF